MARAPRAKSGSESGRRLRRSPNDTGSSPDSPPCSSATILLRRSTSVPSEGVCRGRLPLVRRTSCRRSTTESELLAVVDELNADPNVHGILVQLPLPKGLDEKRVIFASLAGEGRRRASPGEPGPAPRGRARVPALHAARRHVSRSRRPGSIWRASAPSSSVAACSSASRSRCCCSSSTRPSRSVTPARRISRARSAARRFSSRRSARPR